MEFSLHCVISLIPVIVNALSTENLTNSVVDQGPEDRRISNTIEEQAAGAKDPKEEIPTTKSITNTTPNQGAVTKNITNTINLNLMGKNVTNLTMPESFTLSKIVPEIIPVLPKSPVKVNFRDGVSVSFGNNLTPTQVQTKPDVKWNANSDQYYTLIAIDPDLPTRKNPIFREFLQWCVVNIPSSNVTGGETIADYISAGPPPDSGVHRFIFLVYQQPGLIKFNETRINNTTIHQRDGFSTIKFAKKYKLSDPVAGNFFHTTYDSYVPVLYNRLGVRYTNAAAPLMHLNIILIALALLYSNLL